MLSKAEVQFLKGEKQVSANYARVLRYRIRAKARTPRAVSDDPETWLAAHSLSFITENCNGFRSETSENEGIERGGFHTEMGLSLRPKWRIYNFHEVP
jgi:hypothetical protein